MTAVQQKFDYTCKLLTLVLAFMIPISTTMTQITLIGIVILWFCSGNIYPKIRYLANHPVVQICLLLFSIVLLGIFYSPAPLLDSFAMFLKMLKILYIPFLIILFTEKQWRNRFIMVFISAMVFTLTLSLLKEYIGLPIPDHPSHGRHYIFKNHIDTNLMMSLATFFVAHYTFQTSVRQLKLIGIGLMTLMTFYVFWMCEGRTGYVIFVALWFTFLLQRFSSKAVLFGIPALLLISSSAWMGSHTFQQRIISAANNFQDYQTGHTETPVGARLEYLKNSFILGKQHPIFGLGTGGLKEVYTRFAQERDLKLTTANVHNEYMNIFLQWGAVGLITFLALCGSIFKTSFSLPLPERYLAQGTLIATMIGSLANSWLMDFVPGYLFVVFIALANGALTLKEQPWLRR